MQRLSVRRATAGVLPFAAVLCAAGAAQAAPLNVTGILALSPQGADSPARTGSTAASAPSTSADGMITAFVSNAGDLAADHPAGTSQVYIRDRRRGITRLISRATGVSGAPGAGSSSAPSISADGRYIAFVTASNNIDTEDGDDNQDVFVRDISTNVTRLISRGTANGAANGTSNQPSISPDGRYVAFSSNANNLATGDSDGTKDVYVHDRVTRDSKLVSIGLDGLPALGDSTRPDISITGGAVAYESTASNLAPGDALLLSDVFVFDVKKLTTQLVSRQTGVDGGAGLGGSFNPSISADGRYVAFESDADLAGGALLTRDIYVRDRTTNETELVSRQSGPAGPAANGTSDEPDISPDGGFVAFRSIANNLSSQDADPTGDVFVRDLSDGALSLVSRAKDGPAADGSSSEPSITAAAGAVVFASRATNLTSPAPTGASNIYSTALRGTLTVVGTEPPKVNAGLSRFDTDVSCNIMCVVWATGKITVTDANGVSYSRNAAGYGAQAISAGTTRNVAVYLLPNTVTWLKRELAAGKTAAVEIKLEGFGMRGEKATGYSRGPVTLPPPPAPPAT